MANPPLVFLPWSSALSRILKPALPGTSRQFIKRQVLRQKAHAGRISDTAVVLRFESSELVVVAAAGQGLLPASNTIVKFARENGFKTIRFHTQRKGLFRYLKHLPFVPVGNNGSEWVYRMTVK